MKLAVIWSSPNTDGLTASAKEKLINGAKKAGAEVTEIHLNRKSIAHCAACGNGWGTCRSSGECVIKDGFQEVYKTLQEADGIVIVTAVYWHDMTEQIKAFTDRLRRCETGHNPVSCFFLMGGNLDFTGVPAFSLYLQTEDS